MSGMSNNQNTKGYDTTADSSKVILYDESGNVINSSNPLPATAVITGDMNVDTNSVAGMLIGKSGGGDFTAVSAGLGAVITIGTMPYPHTFIADDIISVQQISSVGAVSNTYTRDDATMVVAGGTALTITGATFAVDDTFVVYTNIPKVIVDDANTARTTATQVQPTQNIDATGKVSPAGETVGNAPFAKITDGVETALISISGALKVIEDVVAKSGFLIGKSGGSDFTTIYTSVTTITIGTLPYTHTLLADDIISIIQISVAGVVLNTYTRSDATMTVSGLVLTVAGASFNSDDTFIIYTNISRELYTGSSVSSAPYTNSIVTNPDRASIFAEQAFNAQAAADDATVAGLSQVTSLGFEAQLAGFTGILTAWSTLDGTTKLAQLRFKKEGTVVNEINSTTETANYSCEFEDDFMHQVILSMTWSAGSVSATIFGKGV